MTSPPPANVGNTGSVKTEGVIKPTTNQVPFLKHDNSTNPYDKDADHGSRKGKISSYQGYEHQGENTNIGVILTLKNEKFSNKVVFSIFIDKMRNHVLTNFDHGKDIVLILESLKDPKFDLDKAEPKELTETERRSDVKKWMKQEEVKLHIKRIKALESNKEKIYALIWGQCSHALQEVLKGDMDFDIKDHEYDCIWLLEKVKLASAGVNSKMNKHYTLLQALTSFCTIKQGINESNDSFQKRVDAASLTLTLIGGEHFLCNPDLIETVDPLKPTEQEINHEIEKVKSMVMVLRSDPARYNALHDSLMDGVYKGRDEFPTSVTGAYELLQHTSTDITGHERKRLGRFRFRRNNQYNQRNFTFAQTSNVNPVAGRDGKVYSHVKCHNCNEPGHYSNQCPKVKKNVTFVQFSLTQKKLELINKNWILLDTCSTVSVFCNANLVNNIENCSPGEDITVITNGGSESFAQITELQLLPLRVHFNESSIANIISLSDVANLDGARITMDSNIEKAINLHYNDSIIQFKECADGLYYWDAGNNNDFDKSKSVVTPYLNFVQTVKSNKSYYSKRDIQGADKARKTQEQLGWPSDSTFERIIMKNHIINCPITINDVRRAQHIYGTATPLLKGQMTRVTPSQVNTNTIPTPIPVLSQHRFLQLYVDFFT